MEDAHGTHPFNLPERSERLNRRRGCSAYAEAPSVGRPAGCARLVRIADTRREVGKAIRADAVRPRAIDVGIDVMGRRDAKAHPPAAPEDPAAPCAAHGMGGPVGRSAARLTLVQDPFLSRLRSVWHVCRLFLE